MCIADPILALPKKWETISITYTDSCFIQWPTIQTNKCQVLESILTLPRENRQFPHSPAILLYVASQKTRDTRTTDLYAISHCSLEVDAVQLSIS